MANSFLNEQHEWGGPTYRPSLTATATGDAPHQQPFTASNSDDLFAPTGYRPASQNHFTLSNVADPFFYSNTTAYNHIPDNFRTPTAPPHQFRQNFVRQHPPHLPSPPPMPQRVHPATFSRIHSPITHDFYRPEGPQFQNFAPSFPPQYQYPFMQQPQSPPIQYVYLPAPIHAPPPPPAPVVPNIVQLPSPSKSLPVITSIPLFNSKSDFNAWDEGVRTLLRHLGIHGHIVDPTAAAVHLRPDLSPSLPPLLSEPPSPAELTAYNRWNENDNVAQYVLVGRLGSLPRQLLPTTMDRTAFLIYQTLCKYFGLRNFTVTAELAASLQTLRCEPNKVQDYVARWRSVITRLQAADFPFSVRVHINNFVKGLPQTVTFATLRALLPSQLERIHDNDIGALIIVTNDALDLEIAFRNNRGPAPTASRPPARQSTSTAPQSSAPSIPSKVTEGISTLNTAARVNRSSLYCNNCKASGHIDASCFQEGGGMAGRQEEYLSNKGRMHAMFAECLEDALSVSAPPLPPDPYPPPASPPPTLDDHPIVPMAAMCVSSVENGLAP